MTKESLLTTTAPLTPEGYDLDEDILNGVGEIAEHIDETKRRTHYMLENERLPAYQDGRLWRMRKSTYREFDRRRQEAALERALRKTENA